MTTTYLQAIHPGEILLEEFLTPLDISQYRLAKDVDVPPRRINEIVHAKRSVSADTALRLAKYFGVSAEFWLNLQAQYDLAVQSKKISKDLEKKVKVLHVQAVQSNNKVIV
ncbi:HigA family addiction module antidote protein [Patescibacteria group bacterium]|nr:HigA family addiction module antidote protein [Patescibacteria group bacterium]MBU1721752.1 HigA family addiction module antidote protein [Patescibacteria group bacterium]MBU1901409.1 HigA family addiction module antidote protein [Patescibacteria group bacterium]